jgi:hypothetical protein
VGGGQRDRHRLGGVEVFAVKNPPAYADLDRIFGPAAGPASTAGRCVLPFPFVIAWDKSQRVNSFACHALVAPALTTIFAKAAKHYGEKEYRRLRLDLFGGCFNHRPMRGGTRLSTHSWGIAVDLDPQRNQLKWGRDRAAFAQPEYAPFWKIVESHGGVSLGRARNMDWMHFQWCKA